MLQNSFSYTHGLEERKECYFKMCIFKEQQLSK